nr:MAG TPA: hypothetical protein [Caudoviricetes sp.]
MPLRMAIFNYNNFSSTLPIVFSVFLSRSKGISVSRLNPPRYFLSQKRNNGSEVTHYASPKLIVSL